MKKDKFFKMLFILTLFIYLTLYFTNVTGYYEYKNYNKMVLTNEQIMKFEEDVKNGKNIDIEEYLTEEQTIKNNKLSNFGKKTSLTISSTITKAITKSFSFLGKFVKE